MNFSELKRGNKIFIHRAWGNFQDNSICLILSHSVRKIKLNIHQRHQVFHYLMLTTNGIVSGEVWPYSNVDKNENCFHWELFE